VGLRDEKLLIFDGSCGVGIQSLGLPPEVWADKYEGCNEYLNVSSPEAVVGLHRLYIDAGARVVETNTFSGTRIVLAEYGLAERTREINRLAVEHARTAISGDERLFVAGSIGPGTKLPTLGHVPVDEMRAAYLEQIDALVEAGVDVLTIETCQDLLQAKIAVVAAFEILKRRDADIPVMLSVTMEPTGTMLVGTDIAAVASTFEPFGLFSLGLNCATGPEQMLAHVSHLSRCWSGRLSVMPNAGMPEIGADGVSSYPLTPEELANRLADFIERDGVSIVGGCCGTTPEHIRRLAEEIERRGAQPIAREARFTPSLASLYQSVDAVQEIPPLLIGERMNANGSRKFKKLLLSDDFTACAKIGSDQERKGAHLLDVCVTFAGRDERADLTRLLEPLITSVKAPLAIDTTNPKTVALALETIPGRCLINSINLEDGGDTAGRVLGLVKQHGAAVIALTISENGMAMTADDKLAVARQIYALAVEQHGLRPQDIYFDALTFTLGSGDPKLSDAALQTLEAIPRIKQALPGTLTSLGVSNVSFGLPKASRKYLNSVFLNEALAAGLDAAIVDAGKILPLSKIPDADREVCLNLIYNRAAADGPTPLEAFIAHFEERQADAKADADDPSLVPEQELADKLASGDKQGLEDLLAILRVRHAPLDIINQILVPAMRRVGELFGKGEMLLPFVLQSAEVMKASVKLLEPHMEQHLGEQGAVVLLATVRGDVHDIGKNLVDIILSNNGYRVINLGTNVPTELIIEQAQEHEVDAIGLSGLLVKSAIAMQDSMPLFAEAGLQAPVLLGGAALTPRFVAEACVPGYPAPVVYCADAFAGLSAMQALERGELKATVHAPRTGPARAKPGPRNAEITRDNDIPSAPFTGARHETEIDPRTLYPYLNQEALFRGRWGFRRGKATIDEYRQLIADEAALTLADLQRRCVEEQLVAPAVAWGYFACHSRADALVVRRDGGDLTFEFPRQELPPHLCIADYFKTEQEGGDLVGFMAVTIGPRIVDQARALFEGDRYRDYLMLHGFAVELTDALAEHWHERMRSELGFGEQRPDDKSGYAAQRYRGSRYGFGYPACPDLDAQRLLFELLDPTAIGITLTETAQMVPEVSTSAIVVHHPQAKYFAV
jgi:5-methyltetrahydrofolate--homocysteine methyltransferase